VTPQLPSADALAAPTDPPKSARVERRREVVEPSERVASSGRIRTEDEGPTPDDSHSIRINDQYRICFVWKDGDAQQVEVVDYH
jgi:plasmid maintenance system killer protein